VQPSSRDGSIGKLAPGMAAQIRDPESGAVLSLHDTGMLWLKGPTSSKVSERSEAQRRGAAGWLFKTVSRALR
jgi:hypothetical protein